MLIDGNTLDSGSVIDTDLCIIGGGAAGIAIAREFHRTPFRVLILETGGLQPTAEAQSLNLVHSTGPHAMPTHSRMRYFGGSTNCWGGNSAPLDPVDFESRRELPADWPISYEEFSRTFARTMSLCQIDDALNMSPDPVWARNPSAFRLPPSPGSMRDKFFLRNTLRFGEVYRELFDTTGSNLDVFLNTHALKLNVMENGSTVEGLEAGTLGGRRFTVKSRIVILAAGIENSALLLSSRDRQESGLGNSHDQVGRYFMGHISIYAGILAQDAPFHKLDAYGLPGDLGPEAMRKTKSFASLQVDPLAQRAQRIFNCVMMMSPVEVPSVNPRDTADRLLEKLRLQWRQPVNGQILEGGRRGLSPGQSPHPVRWNVLHVWSEQYPHADNRLGLSDDVDRLGRPRMKLNWAVRPEDKESLRRAMKMFRRYALSSGLGQIVSALPENDDAWPDNLHAASHFMGGTRMSSDARTGVVDTNCRVFGTDNVYVAGGSIFPRGGSGMVTFNLLALALRLADHIKQPKQGTKTRDIETVVSC